MDNVADDTSGKNIGTILVGRFLIGSAGSLGATLVGGTISDIYPPEESVLFLRSLHRERVAADQTRRGFPMALFAFMAMFWTGIGPVMMSWVEVRPDLGWRHVSFYPQANDRCRCSR